MRQQNYYPFDRFKSPEINLNAKKTKTSSFILTTNRKSIDQYILQRSQCSGSKIINDNSRVPQISTRMDIVSPVKIQQHETKKRFRFKFTKNENEKDISPKKIQKEKLKKGLYELVTFTDWVENLGYDI